MSSSSKKIKLTVVQIDLVKSSNFTSKIERTGGVNLTKSFIENIKSFVDIAFNSVVKHPDEAEEIQSCGGDAYRISLKDVHNAYQFVEKFCQLVKQEDDKEPNKDKLIFRIGAATGTINFDPSSSGLDRITGHNVLFTVSRLVTADPPGYFYVDQETFDSFNENIKHEFENESVTVPCKNHENNIIAYRCQMFRCSNQKSLLQPSETKIQNANNIVNYIFVIVTPHPTVNTKYLITSQVAQFENNDTKMNTPDSETIITLSNIDQGYSKNQIISVAINEIINQLKSKPNIFNPTPIIELFLPNKLLIEDFGIKKIKEAGLDQPIGHLYPFTVRSYNRFTDQASKARLELRFQKLKEMIAKTNDINNLKRNLKEYCHLITQNDLKLKPDKFYIKYITPGTPLCLWMRCSLEEDNRTIDDVYQEIFNISNNDFCKVSKIYEQLLSIRQKYYREHEEKLIVGVLFDHDKLPKQISQLTSPNMSMNTA
jgi:hypothetical protein